MPITIPRLLGEVHDRDTQFTAMMKQNQELVLIGGVIAILLLVFIVYASIPNTRQGTWRFGICKVLLERLSEYPSELKILTVAEKSASAQIGYLTTNSYGSQESELMECFYNMKGTSITVNRVTINRKSLKFSSKTHGEDKGNTKLSYQQIFELYETDLRQRANQKFNDLTLDDFNKTIPVIMAQDDLDLTMPAPLSSNIEDLKYD